MQAIILAGGFGRRLQEVVSDVPKPMAPIGGEPFLALLLGYLKQQGVKEVVISAYYKKELIEEFFGNDFKGVSIKYAIEDNPLGTGGAIINSLNILKPRNSVLVVNGDTFLSFNVQEMLKKHQESEGKLTIALKKVEDCSRYGQVVIEKGIITDFSHSGSNGEGYINAGRYIMEPDLFDDYSLNNAFSFERDFLYQHTPEIKPLAFLTNEYFIDIGVPEDYRRACEELPLIIEG